MTPTDRRPRRWPRPSSPREARIEIWLIVGLLLLGVVLPLVVSTVAGSLEIPRNDDWSYRRISLELARTGRLALDGASQTMIVGQMLLAQPFLWLSGLQPWAFAVAGVVFATAGVASAYVLARQVLPPRLAVIPALLLVIFPGYLAYATSFMSDVPGLAAEFVCLALGARALSRRPVPTSWLLASVAVGFFAFSIRDFAVAAPASVLLAALCAEPRRRRHWAIAIATAACCIALYLWRATLSGQLGDVGPRPAAPGRIIPSLFTIGFMLAPVAILATAKWRHHWRRFDVLIGLEIGLLVAGARVVQWLMTGGLASVFLDNLTSPWGVPARDYILGGRPVLFGDDVWAAINALALVGTVITLAVTTGIVGFYLRRNGRSRRGYIAGFGSPLGVLLLFVAGTGAGLILFGLRFSLFDRYLWALVPPLAALFLQPPPSLQEATRSESEARLERLIPVAALGLAGVLAIMSTIYMLNSHAFDAARWRAGETLVAAGVATDRIDAGYEWMGYYATTVAHAAQPDTTAGIWYRGWWPSFQMCGVVSSTPRSRTDEMLIGSIPYQLNLVAGPSETLYIYRVTGPECGSTPIE